MTIEEFKEAVQRSCVGKDYRDFPQAMKMFIDSHFKIVDLNGTFMCMRVVSIFNLLFERLNDAFLFRRWCHCC